MNELDMSMDVFLVSDLQRDFVPKIDVDVDAHAAVFASFPHPVPPENILKAMTWRSAGAARAEGRL